jgi:hypothetical protein
MDKVVYFMPHIWKTIKQKGHQCVPKIIVMFCNTLAQSQQVCEHFVCNLIVLNTQITIILLVSSLPQGKMLFVKLAKGSKQRVVKSQWEL